MKPGGNRTGGKRVVVRCLIYLLLLCSASAAYADPVLLLLLRMLRDQAISSSLEAGVTSLRQPPSPQSPAYGFALSTPPGPRGTEESRVRALIDDSFLHLSGVQRDAVFAGMQKILNDPQYAQIRAQLVAEFTLKARAVREGYRNLDRLTHTEKRALAIQAKEEFRHLPAEQRHQLLEALQAGVLPVPRDLSEIMLAEFGSVVRAVGGGRLLD
jgi:hypothetical protein